MMIKTTSCYSPVKNNEKNAAENEECNDWEKEVMKIQYEKLSNDWRSFNNLIWAVPTVAVAIMSGMLIAAYREEFNVIPQVRIAILGLGSLFLFALTIEVIKKRFHMNVITSLLQDIEAKGFELEEKFRFPLGTKGIDRYIEEKSEGDSKKKPDDYSDPVFKFFKISYARKYLTYVILIAAISLALLAEWEFIKFGEYHIWFYIVGIVFVIAPVTATILYYVHYNMLHFKNKLEINRPVADVFSFISNFENMRKWNSFVSKVTKLSEGSIGLNTTFSQARKTYTLEYKYKIIEFEPNRRVTIETLPDSKQVMRFTLFEQANNHTLLIVEWELDTCKKPAFVERLIDGKGKSAENLRKLKQLLETDKVTLQDGRTAVA
jgi:uncharacterized membrane protein